MVAGSSPAGPTENMDSLDNFKKVIEELKQSLASHKLFSNTLNADQVRQFMESHIFSVWGFMSLLKGLQSGITINDIPWMPNQNTKNGLTNFINEIDNSDDILKSHDDAPIIKLFNLILREAISKKASDIHLQVFEDALNIKFRIHGSIENAFTLNSGISARLFTRIKIISGLDITEKRKPQDGRVTINIGSFPIDLRISTIPSYDNERIVLRLLDQRHVELDLSSLGMLDVQLDEFRSLSVSYTHLTLPTKA